MNPEEGGDLALGMAPEIVQGKAFVLPAGETPAHCSPHLAHLRTDKARTLFPSFFLIAIVAGDGRREDGLKNRRVKANLLEAVIKSGHFL